MKLDFENNFVFFGTLAGMAILAFYILKKDEEVANINLAPSLINSRLTKYLQEKEPIKAPTESETLKQFADKLKKEAGK